MSISIPADTDWSANFSAEQMVAKREAEADEIALAESLAWSLLASLTAYQIGTAPITVRPCAAQCTPTSGYLTAPVASGGGLPAAIIGQPFPFVSGGRWYNACGCRGEGDCSCSALSEVFLPGPVGGIVSVKVDGVTLSPSAYRVDNGYRLVRVDGQKWPVCQDMSLPEDAVGAFAVTYYRGAAPNLLTRAAAGALAYEFYQEHAGRECRLPWNIVAATRDGETLDFGEGGMDEAMQALPVVASVIRVYNPYGLKTRPKVIVPGAAATRRTTWQKS